MVANAQTGATLVLYLAGMKFGDADLFTALPQGLGVIAKRHPENPYDKNAIGIYVTNDILLAHGLERPKFNKSEWRLGWVPAKGPVNWAAALAPFMDEGLAVTGRLRSFDIAGAKVSVWLEGQAIERASYFHAFPQERSFGR